MLRKQGDYEKYLTLTPEERIKKVLEIQELLEENHQTPSSKANLLLELGNLLDAAKEYEAAIAKSNKGFALMKLDRYEEAITSFDKVLEIQPSHHIACYKKACCYALQGNIEQAIENLQQAINLSPDECREWAKTDSDFDSIREDERFHALIQEPLPGN
jgi:tetratricopeptide (TPR) repeat protein